MKPPTCSRGSFACRRWPMVSPISIEETSSSTPHHTCFCNIRPDSRNTRAPPEGQLQIQKSSLLQGAIFFISVSDRAGLLRRGSAGPTASRLQPDADRMRRRITPLGTGPEATVHWRAVWRRNLADRRIPPFRRITSREQEKARCGETYPNQGSTIRSRCRRSEEDLFLSVSYH
jgi:hypothetical protein